MKAEVIIEAFSQAEIENLIFMRRQCYTFNELADMFGKSRQTLRRYMRVHKLYGITAFSPT